MPQKAAQLAGVEEETELADPDMEEVARRIAAGEDPDVVLSEWEKERDDGSVRAVDEPLTW